MFHSFENVGRNVLQHSKSAENEFGNLFLDRICVAAGLIRMFRSNEIDILYKHTNMFVHNLVQHTKQPQSRYKTNRVRATKIPSRHEIR